MSLDDTKQAGEKFPELTALGKIQSRIDKVKLIIQDKDRDFTICIAIYLSVWKNPDKGLLIR